jgi:hypothetical protein
MEDAHCKPNPWVSLRHDQLIPVNKAVNKKEQLEKGLEEEEKKVRFLIQLSVLINLDLILRIYKTVKALGLLHM